MSDVGNMDRSALIETLHCSEEDKSETRKQYIIIIILVLCRE